MFLIHVLFGMCATAGVLITLVNLFREENSIPEAWLSFGKDEVADRNKKIEKKVKVCVGIAISVLLAIITFITSFAI